MQPSDADHTPESSSVLDKDAALLASLGYRQDFKRTFTRLELFGVGFSLIGVFPSVAYVVVFLSQTLHLQCFFRRGVLIFAIPYGGPVAMVWGVRIQTVVRSN